MKYKQETVLNKERIFSSLKQAVSMLTPRIQIHNPVMFVTYVAASLTTVVLLIDLFNLNLPWFHIHIALWLWLTVLFANFAEAIAETKGRLKTASLKKAKVEAYARQERHGIEIKVPSDKLRRGDIIICEAGDIIPADGEVIEGIATIDESAITGESAPVLRESGSDRNAVTAGTKLLSDRLKIRVTSEPGNSFLDRWIDLIEGGRRQKTSNEMALHVVLSALTFIFLLVIMSLKPLVDYGLSLNGNSLQQPLTVPILAAILVCLIPTSVSALLNTLGIAAIDRLIRRNVVVLNAQPLEAAGDIDLLIIDKTGTITIGNRMATAFFPALGVPEKEFAKIAQLASLSDETPEGRSIVILAKSQFDLRADSLESSNIIFVPFSPQTKMSGIDFKDPDEITTRSIRKGSPGAIRKHIENRGSIFPDHLNAAIQSITNKGGTPLLVSDNDDIVGIIHLKDMIKGGIKEKFTEMRKMGIKTVMVTGDNPLTAATIAAEAGIDEYIAEATPEMKLDKIKQEQASGLLVAMAGDGTNDAPALAQADVGVAMNTGTQASREAGNIIDLDSNPTKLIDIVEIGKQILMTRGALTTLSIAVDVGKYFALIPAIFGSLYALEGSDKGPLTMLNIMHLHSPHSAILSTLIINALIILALIPLSLRGVQYRAQPAHMLLKRNILIYGLGGLTLPFVAIKLVDSMIYYLV